MAPRTSLNLNHIENTSREVKRSLDKNMKQMKQGPINHCDEISKIQDTLNNEDLDIAQLTQLLARILDFSDLSMQENVAISRIIQQITKKIVEHQYQ